MGGKKSDLSGVIKHLRSANLFYQMHITRREQDGGGEHGKKNTLKSLLTVHIFSHLMKVRSAAAAHTVALSDC